MMDGYEGGLYLEGGKVEREGDKLVKSQKRYHKWDSVPGQEVHMCLRPTAVSFGRTGYLLIKDGTLKHQDPSLPY